MIPKKNIFFLTVLRAAISMSFKIYMDLFFCLFLIWFYLIQHLFNYQFHSIFFLLSGLIALYLVSSNTTGCHITKSVAKELKSWSETALSDLDSHIDATKMNDFVRMMDLAPNEGNSSSDFIDRRYKITNKNAK